MPATSVRSSNGTVVGGRPIDTAIASTETSVVLPPDSDVCAVEDWSVGAFWLAQASDAGWLANRLPGTCARFG